jgi:SAM-dependent methyltransferase
VGSFVEKLTFRGWFTTEDGTRFPRYWGHSFIVVPRKLWSGLASEPKAASAPTEIHLLRRRLQEAGVSATGADVLEIGAALKPRAIAIDEARSVLCIDHRPYYDDDSRAAVELSPVWNRPGVRFQWDDACDSDLPDASVDLAVSWEVLEHLASPEGFFRSMRRVLRPSGLLYARYNPFFAINGGHSACTLDSAWAHAMLSSTDFRRYVSGSIGLDREESSRFFDQFLNRMCLADLRDLLDSHSFEVLDMHVAREPELVRLATSARVTQVKRRYPRANADDLLATRVELLARRA